MVVQFKKNNNPQKILDQELKKCFLQFLDN